MTNTIVLGSGVLLGALGALWHLAVVHVRARGLTHHGWTWTQLLMPVGLLGPALAVWLAAHVAPLAAWVCPLGMIAARTWVLRHRTRET